MLKYPKHILPKKGYKRIDNCDIPHESIFLRTIKGQTQPCSQEDIKKGYKAYARKDHWRGGLSVNLLGRYSIEDCKYHLLKNNTCSDDWKEKDGDAKLPSTDNFEYVDNMPYVGLSAKCVKEFNFIYKDANQQFSFDNRILEEGPVNITLDYCHAPTQCNFWHFNIWALLHQNGNRKCINTIEEFENNEDYIDALSHSTMLVPMFVLPSKMRPKNLHPKAFVRGRMRILLFYILEIFNGFKKTKSSR